MKKLFFIPLVIFGLFIFLALPLKVLAFDFSGMAAAFASKNCGESKPTKDQTLGTICYLINEVNNLKNDKPKTLVVYDNKGVNKLGLFMGRKTGGELGFVIFSTDLERIVWIGPKGKLLSSIWIYFEDPECPLEAENTVAYIESIFYYDSYLDLIPTEYKGELYYYKILGGVPVQKTFQSALYLNTIYTSEGYGTGTCIESNVSMNAIPLTPLSDLEKTKLPIISDPEEPLIIKSE